MKIYKICYIKKLLKAIKSKVILVVGLGNPGYEQTKHNLGSDLCKIIFSASCGKLIYKEKEIELLTSPSWINNSGEAILPFYLKLNRPNLIILSDDMETPINKVKYGFSLKAKGHNGLKNIISHLGSQFWSIKIGIGRPYKEDVKDFVLDKSIISLDLISKVELALLEILKLIN